MIYKFRSTDLGAPVLSGTVGTLVAILDACLVNGYNSVAVSSMTRSGAVVTVNCSAPHGFAMYGVEGPIAQISGAAETDYNGKWKVASVISANVFTFNIGVLTPATPATGSITSKFAPLGWTKPFSGTNKAVYLQPVGTNQRYLRLDDNSPTGGNAQGAAARGYEAMTDVDTGTGPFPTVAQNTNGAAFGKSNTLNSTARPWSLIGDEAFFYFMPDGETSGTPGASTHSFGDLATPYKPGDAYHTFINGYVVSTNYGSMADNDFTQVTASTIGAQSYKYCARAFNQLGSAVAMGFAGYQQTIMGQSGMLYPAPHDNGLYVYPIRVFEGSAGGSTGAIRGTLPGVYSPLHNNYPFVHGDVFDNITGLPGKTLMARSQRESGSSAGYYFIDLTGPWR